MLEKIVYTIRDQSAIFQLSILSSLTGARVYHVLLVEKSGTFITYSVMYYINKRVKLMNGFWWNFDLHLIREILNHSP
jgi:hypothetical protein